MASLRSRFSLLWLLVVVTEAVWRTKLIGDEAACESKDNMISARSVKTSEDTGPEPGDLAAAFTVRTLDGEFSYQPGALRGPLIIHAFTNKSGFLECLWSSESSLSSLVQNLPDSAQVLFLSLDDSAVTDALWMREQLQRAAVQHSKKEVLSRLHFSPVPVFALGNWIPAVFYYWGCTSRNCVLAQAVFTSEGWNMPVVIKRLDARYDWLMARWSQKSYRLMDAGDGCHPSPLVEGAVAWVSEGNCSFFTKVQSMAKSNATGVLVYALPGNPIQDMNCDGHECDTPLSIPAAMVHLEPSVAQALRFGQSVVVSLQNTPSPGFFFSVDQQGALAEIGWFLYPSFSFINWQAQWLRETIHGIAHGTVFMVKVHLLLSSRGSRGDTSFQVELYAVITAHGSDDNRCGEFCVTSHHFLFNTVFNNTLIFDSAGSPLGCTTQVKEGAVPNEYGTWLYGRGGWCDGQQVNPWRVDITEQLNVSESNTVLYFSAFSREGDPNPRKDPGYIIMSSFLSFTMDPAMGNSKV
ncbi:LOW QUALITY PROTEIN: uncharacterized protein si:dkey-256h2.1 [Morone saxatilis]|uniref:LOW QUALITY PROTEIN: uncharacterized protein si:dkey-256h2.1 n=1 Tax=Morone saxatilis TaxID=34816 RepID=UPI0015E23B35|nr:LOW QUALITY PROTEIN: uncharacterized protein si:dkey-256h2.1 [Morone saxatilis]